MRLVAICERAYSTAICARTRWKQTRNPRPSSDATQRQHGIAIEPPAGSLREYMAQKRDRRLIPHFSRSRFFAIVGTGRSPLHCGALPPAKRHGSESRYHFCVAHRRARHHLARVLSLTHVGADCADKDHCAPRMSPYGMPPCETHAGGTQCMPLSRECPPRE